MRLATKIYREPGCRRDIVLIHGTGARGEMWHRQIQPLLDKGFRCIVPDLRGHGDSHEPGERTDLDAHVQDLLDTLQDAEVKLPVTFAGHSLGALISVEIAQRHADVASKILAVSMPGKVPLLTKEAFRWFLGWPYHGLRTSGIHRHFDWRTRELIGTNKHALEQIAEHIGELDFTENVPQVQCPVHLAVGRFDPVATYTEVLKLHKVLPTSTLRVIEWAGHNPMDSQPDAFNKWFFEVV